jgi:Tol biopolymer transport system component
VVLIVGMGITSRLLSGTRATPPEARAGVVAADSGVPVGSMPGRLAYVTNGLNGGPGPALWVADGGGRSAVAPPAGRRASTFVWSPDGTRQAVVDLNGDLRVLPGGGRFPGPVRTVAFSPDGRVLAACVGRASDRIVLLDVRHPTAPMQPSLRGCDPVWSPDGAFLAYRLPTGRVGLFSTLSDVRSAIDASWPAAWAPVSSIPGPLTVVTRRGIESMSPGGGERRTLISQPQLRALTRMPRLPSVIMLAWSPDGRWLAMAFGPGNGVSGGVAVVNAADPDRSTSEMSGPRSGRTHPVSLSWSAQDLLLASFAARGVVTTTAMIGGTGTIAHLDGLAEPSWSPDGRWILGRATGGWTAIDPADLARRVKLAARQSWTAAAWCCPPVPVVRP